ncbi:MAG: hypothetical protein LBP59_13930 [Planctomycetaceae bacterium]|nr:hypothetical protein [Planctomycetaceae bacterium]
MTLQKGIIREGYDLGFAEGELKAMRNSTLAILRNRFGDVPQYLIKALNERTDVIAMESLIITAADCKTLVVFESEL